MAFKTADFKKTTRMSGGVRVMYPSQIRDDRYTAAIGYAINYYERMVGRRQAEFEAETILEFFGDPRLARGLVACLSRTYAWREQSFAEVFGDDTAKALWRAKLANPAALRTRLYGLANGRYGGVILPRERTEALQFLCDHLDDKATENAENIEDQEPTNKNQQLTSHISVASVSCVARKPLLTPAQFEQGLTLDAEDQRVLAKYGSMPTPQEIIARYNFHSLETALCHAEWLQLRLRGPVWSIVRSAHNLGRRYKLRYTIDGAPRTLFDEQLVLTLHGAKDGFGHWLRTGRRVARALLRLLATHPDCLVSAEALVHVGAQDALLKLDERAMQVLGIGAASEMPDDSEAWDEDVALDFQKAWGKAYVRGRTAGWRVRRDPEPLIGAKAVIVPDFVLQRGNERLALCLATGKATALALTRDLAQLGRRSDALAIVPDHVAEELPHCPVPLAHYAAQPADAIPSLVALLERKHPRGRADLVLTPWQRLERQVEDEGFVGEEAVAALLGCPPDEALQTVRRWGGPKLHVLAGLGVCAPDSLDDIRHLIDESDLTQHAAA